MEAAEARAVASDHVGHAGGVELRAGGADPVVRAVRGASSIGGKGVPAFESGGRGRWEGGGREKGRERHGHRDKDRETDRQRERGEGEGERGGGGRNRHRERQAGRESEREGDTRRFSSMRRSLGLSGSIPRLALVVGIFLVPSGLHVISTRLDLVSGNSQKGSSSLPGHAAL